MTVVLLHCWYMRCSVQPSPVARILVGWRAPVELQVDAMFGLLAKEGLLMECALYDRLAGEDRLPG